MVDAPAIDQLFQQGHLHLALSCFPNQALTLVDAANPAHTALAIAEGEQGDICPLTKLPAAGISRIKARNREQQFALDLLLRETIPLVTLVGRAGTGKTLLALAAGLYQVADQHRYTRLLNFAPRHSHGAGPGLSAR